VTLTTLICYDISDDQTRAHAAAAIQQWGNRIQRSVFLCSITEPDKRELVTRLHQMINSSTDSVYLIDLCKTCWGGSEVLGQANVTPPPLYWAVL
jgi:CRISPR-associated protein Cas2